MKDVPNMVDERCTETQKLILVNGFMWNGDEISSYIYLYYIYIIQWIIPSYF